jgi:hypothetical protein
MPRALHAPRCRIEIGHRTDRDHRGGARARQH